MGPSKVAFNQVSVVPTRVLRVISDGFCAPTRALSEKDPTIFRKHLPWGIGTESVGMIGCIFAENGPLEGGIESSFSGTGWGAKGDFRWIFGPNPCIFGRGPHHFPNAHALRYRHRKFGNDQMYIFEWRTHTLLESTCPELYAQQSWEWSDAYSWRNDLWKVNFKRVCKKPTGVLMVIWSGFLAPTPAFFEGGPHHFPKILSLRYGHRKFGNDWMYIRGEWVLRMWHWIKFQWYRLGC